MSVTRALLVQLTDADLVVLLQCLGELFRMLTGKAGYKTGWAHHVWAARAAKH